MYQKIIKNMFSSALNFVFPPSESVKEFENTSSNDLVQMLPGSEPFENVSSRAESHDSMSVFTLFAYGDERVKHLVWEIKYYRNQKVIDLVGILLAGKIQAEIARKNDVRNATENGEKFFLVPIPLTNRRLRERGYNHTELLTKSILENLPENFALAADTLKKIRHTPKQSSIENREERFTNIVGAFEVSNLECVKNQNIIIVDDVVTTGATAAEAKRVLVSAGAKSVWVVAVAH